jgi:hypothetical protein
MRISGKEWNRGHQLELGRINSGADAVKVGYEFEGR